MEKNNLTIIFIIVALIVFGVGIQLGSMMKKTPSCPEASKCLLDSKAISNWVASTSGEVKGISGRNLVLLSNNEKLEISLIEGVIIQKMIVGEGKIPETASLSDIRVGQKIEVQLVVTSGGKLFGSLVTILI
jgi:hypothetical protein